MLKLLHKRYSGGALLAALVFAQLIALGYQLRTNRDIPLLRYWIVGAAAPLQKGLQRIDETVSGVWSRYLRLIDKAEEERETAAEMSRLRLENQWLRQSLRRFDSEAELVAYRRESPSQTVLARVIAGGSSPLSKELFLDRGKKHGIRSGMAVVTAQGIVGKVQACYPSACLVLLVNDTESGAGVVLADSRARGVLKGTGGPSCTIDYILPEAKASPGELVYTSGDDRVFPRGLPVGRVARVAPGMPFQGISVDLFASPDTLEEALIVTQGVHMELPHEAAPDTPGVLAASAGQDAAEPGLMTSADGLKEPPAAKIDADRIKQRYRRIVGEQGGRVGGFGLPPPDFNFAPGAQPPAGGASAPVAGEREEKRL